MQKYDVKVIGITLSRNQCEYSRAFFDMAHRVLPDDGRILLRTILGYPRNYFYEQGIPVTISDLKFMQFIGKEIFPGGELPGDRDVVEFSQSAGSSVERIQLLRPHYARTLDMWAAKLVAVVTTRSRSRPKWSTTAISTT